MNATKIIKAKIMEAIQLSNTERSMVVIDTISAFIVDS